MHPARAAYLPRVCTSDPERGLVALCDVGYRYTPTLVTPSASRRCNWRQPAVAPRTEARNEGGLDDSLMTEQGGRCN